MPGNPDDNPYIATFLTVSTLSGGIPAMKVMLEDGRITDCAFAFLLFFTSMMYHLSESWRTNSLLLTEMQWHKLDNVGVLSTMGATFVYVADFKSEKFSYFLRWVLFFLILVLQERDPWDTPISTGIPVACFVGIVTLRWIYAFFTKSWKPRYVWKNFWLGFICLAGLGGPCFVLGLDDANDPNRMFHFLWHLFGAMSSYYFNCCLPPRNNKKLKHQREIEDDLHGGRRSRSISIGQELGYH